MFRLNQKGEGKAGAIFGFLLLGLAIYVAWKVIPVMIRVYEFEDKVKESCKFSQGNVPALEDKIIKHAQEVGVPVDYEDLNINVTNQVLRATIRYTIPIEFPGYTYNWDAEVNYEAPIF